MSNYRLHAEREFKAAGWDLEKDKMQAMICKDILEMLDLFASHGHSGSTAPYAIKMFSKLAAFEPLVPLTGEEWEWQQVGPTTFQNIRCSHVFKDSERFNGQAYDIEGKIFREPDGCCYTSFESAVPVTFPYIPHSEYVDRLANI